MSCLACASSSSICADPDQIVSRVQVVAITDDRTGQGYDLTDHIEGLNWSSVNPGGDETCTFTLKRSWFAGSPEIERGNLLRVMDGVDVLWQGRVEEAERGGESTEHIGVTAYGLGARLKDTTMQEIYIDQDLSRWGSIPNPRIVALGTQYITDMGNAEVRPSSSGEPVLSLIFTRLANPNPPNGLVEAWYDAAGVEIGSLLYTRTTLGLGGSWVLGLGVTEDQAATGAEYKLDLIAAGSSGKHVAAEGKVFALTQLYFASAFTGDGDWRADLTLAVLGRHGLALQGSDPGGFLNSQMIVDAVQRAAGIAIRRIDPTAYINGQAAFLDPSKIEDVVIDLNRFEAHHRTWGTWGPDSPLDNSTDGYFDYRSIDADPTWIAFRAECDNCNLHSETAKLFDIVNIRYTDSSGVQRTVTRTAVVPDLNGIPREETIDGGKMTTAGAETLADAVLALSGRFAPARGSAVVSRPIRHTSRGVLPAHYMRADGSAFRIPDILPASSLFALDTSPNRRTTFPIKRIAVDASSKAVPVVTVEVDQTNDAISALQAQLAQGGQSRGSQVAQQPSIGG
jgi:hypothetical protein